MTTFNIFLSGALAMACLTSGMFFLRFWRQTRDAFFRTFALAFFMLGIERIFLIGIAIETEGRTYVYFIRLIAYLLIIKAIYVKNRPPRATAPQ